jgi:catechol 2,3-dioxygenase-like lactoylglutathione lyase family enzyme
VIHHVQLACPAGSEPALREFYGGVLGLAELTKPPVLAARGGCWFRGHGIELHLGVEEDFRPARKAHPGLLVEDLDAWAARLREAGYPVAYDDRVDVTSSRSGPGRCGIGPVRGPAAGLCSGIRGAAGTGETPGAPRGPRGAPAAATPGSAPGGAPGGGAGSPRSRPHSSRTAPMPHRAG